MLFELKRIFSSIKHIISNERASLKANTIKILECVKHWMQANIYIDKNLNVVITTTIKKNKNI